MENKCDWIGLRPSEFFEDHRDVVDVQVAIATFRCDRLTANGWLVSVLDGIKVKFAVLDEIGSRDGQAEAVVLWHGNGIGGSLRELRHSYWGEDGYIHSLDASMKLIGKSLLALEEFFDARG